MKVYITKYALTEGILLFDHALEFDGEMIRVGGQWYYGKGNEWHPTRSAAVARAEEMRRKRIDSLRDQIADLEKLTFE